MDRLLVHDPRSGEPVRSCRSTGLFDRRSEIPQTTDEARGEHALGSRFRLPPTRAARSARSRGVFLEVARRWLGAENKARRINVSRVTVAIAAVAATSVLIVSAPSLVVDTAVAAHRGLALIGAATAPPSFMAPSKKH